MSTSTQLLKAYGHLPTIGLDKLADNRARQFSASVDSAVLAGRVCGHPDLADEEVADATLGDLQGALGMEREEGKALRRAHRRMLSAGAGSIPAGCHLDLYPHPDRHCATYFVKRDTFGQNYMRGATESELRHMAGAGVWNMSAEQMLDRFLGQPILEVGLYFLKEAYRRVGIWLLEVDQISGLADIVLLSRFISGSTIGIGWFNDGSCSDRVESHYDSSWKPDLYELSLLLNHEVGHNLNLQHQFQNQKRHKGVMSYSWPNNSYGFLTGDEGILPRDPSWDPLTRFFGGEPIPRDDTPTPQPGLVELEGTLYGENKPGIAFPVFRGTVTIPAGFQTDRDVRLIVTPMPDQPGKYKLKEPVSI